MISGVVGGMEAILATIDSYKLVEGMIKNFTKMRWGEIIRETTSLSKELTEEKIEDIIFLLNDESNLKEMEEYFKKSSPYELEEVMKDYIYLATFTLNIDLKDNERKEFADLFFEIFCSYVKEKNKEMYDKLIINKKLNELLKNKIKYKTLKKVEDTLKDNTEFPFKKINLNFFDYEDEEFSKNLKEKIENGEKTIYIEGNSKEETYYCILSELKRIEKQDRKVYIIDEKKEWDKCDGKIKDGILIPIFHSEELFPILNNINIIIIDKNEGIGKKGKIILKRRLSRNLEQKLSEFTSDSTIIYKTMKDTNGIYACLKRKLFEGKFGKPKWIEKINSQNKDYVILALLLNSWRKTDKEALEKIFNINYDTFITELSPFISGEDPFIINPKVLNSKYWIANPEEAWVNLLEYIKDKEKSILISKSIEILSNIEEVYKNDLNDIFISLISDQKKYSVELKTGLIKSLILYKIINEDLNISEDIDHAIKEILERILNNKEIEKINKLAYISEYILDLCEASPEVIVEFFERELIKADNKLVELFKKGAIYNSFGKNYYIDYLWALEYLLHHPKLISRVINLLCILNEEDISYTANSPEKTLQQFFCPWLNEVPISIEKKIDLASSIIIKYQKGWDIIFYILPNGTLGMTFSTLAKPHYLGTNIKSPILESEVYNKIITNYSELCIRNTKTIEQWEKVLSSTSFTQYEDIDIFLKLFLKECNDREKEKIKSEIRKLIYENKFFEFEFSEKQMKKFMEIYNSIKFSREIWNYVYLFKKYNFNGIPLLNPVPFKEENYHEENEIKRKDLIITELKKFKSEYEDEKIFMELINLNIIEDYYQFSEFMVDFCSEEKYNEKILLMLLKIENIIPILRQELILSYSAKIYEKYGINELSKIILKLEKKQEGEILKNLIFNFRKLEDFYFLERLDEKLQSEFWKNSRLFAAHYDKNTCLYISKKYLEYGNGNIFNFLVINNYSGQEYLNILKEINERNNFDFRKAIMPEMYIEKILTKIYEGIEMNEEILGIELYFYMHGLLKQEKMKCFMYFIKKSPQLYSEIINYAFKHDGEEKAHDNVSRNFYEFYSKVEFCPCTHETNDINEEELKKWVNDFKKLLLIQNQEYLFERLLGKLFANSPQGNDGFYPHESVRNIIENFDCNFDEIGRNYIITILNSRGCHSFTAGKKEKQLADKYKTNAEGIEIYSPKTARIYYNLSKKYQNDSIKERERAEYNMLL